ncbi:hypothetical protein [Aestuariivirga sp.]|uniref:hypothetical protein n=1 Tax=Aestuariivirga sp. TaxID=2650926 RepID=UPI003918CB41
MWRVVLSALFLVSAAGPAFAHASGRGFVLLLPTGYVIAGGALAVLVSFLAVSLLPHRKGNGAPEAAEEDALRYGRGASLVSAAVVVFVIIAGLLGPNDPAENILPLTVWTLWWVLIVMLHPLFGNLWASINPFTGLHGLLNRGAGSSRPPLAYPLGAAYWPACLIFFAFAWFQLVYPAPEDRDVLVRVVSLYLCLTLVAVFLFGPQAWLGRADPFAVFLRQLGACAPSGPDGLRWPGAGLLKLPVLPVSGVLFVLLTLSSITFDGFANTFFWLSSIGINPLDHPGRTYLVAPNTLGLIGAFLVLATAFLAAVAAGWLWAGRPSTLPGLCGRLVYSLIPISIAYHFAHYLGDTLVNLQYLALTLNDPLSSGADLLGLGQFRVTASFQNTASGALALFSAQTAAIVIGHVVGVAVAHAMVAGSSLARPAMLRLELPLTAAMVLYTAFGLWLLSTPSAA